MEKLIQDIADQTNLLALNATIEKMERGSDGVFQFLDRILQEKQDGQIRG